MRLCAVVLWAMLVMGSVTMTSAQSAEPPAPDRPWFQPLPPRVTFEGTSVLAQIYNVCAGAKRWPCYHYEPPPCPQTAVCVPTLAVAPGGGLFINTRRSARSVKATVNSQRAQTYRATARRWALALPPAMPERGRATIVVSYRDGAVITWHVGLNAVSGPIAP